MSEVAEASKAGTKTEKIAVSMSDGRTVDFNKKQKLVKTTTFNDDGTWSTRFDFSNGESRIYSPREDVVQRLAAHGAEQKLGDSIAGEQDVNDAVLAFDDVLNRLNNGEWTKERQGGSFTGTSVLIRALVEASGKTIEEIKAFLENKSQAEKIALRRSEKLKPIIERLEAEKAKTSKNQVDTDALLGELGLEAHAHKNKKAA